MEKKLSESIIQIVTDLTNGKDPKELNSYEIKNCITLLEYLPLYKDRAKAVLHPARVRETTPRFDQAIVNKVEKIRDFAIEKNSASVSCPHCEKPLSLSLSIKGANPSTLGKVVESKEIIDSTNIGVSDTDKRFLLGGLMGIFLGDDEQLD